MALAPGGRFADAVGLLASTAAEASEAGDEHGRPAFGPAFHQSADQNDYRWGLLHRLVLAHPLGGPFDVPPAFGQFPAPLPGLAGIPSKVVMTRWTR